MSLIQEALRRQQMENQQGTQKPVPPPGDPSAKEAEPLAAAPSTTEPEVPATPPPTTPAAPMPSESNLPPKTDPPPPAEDRKRATSSPSERSMLPTLLGAIAVFVILFGLVGWAALYGFRAWQQRPDNQESAPTNDGLVAEAAPKPDTQPETAPEDLAPAMPPVPEPDQAAPAADSEEVAQLETDAHPEPPATAPPATGTEAPAPPAPTPADPSVPDPPSAPVPPTQPEPQLAPPPPEPEPAEPIIWPDIHVAGVIGSGSGGSAIINGTVMGLDEKFEDVTVVGFKRGQVILEYQGETKSFSVGRKLR